MAFDLTARLRMIDDMSRPLRRMTSSLVGFGGRMTGITASVGALTSAVGGVAGAVGLYSKAIKGASNLEQNMISMEHFIGLTSGAENAKKAAADYLAYLRKNADLTPFETGDVIDSGRRLVNVAGGDISMAKKLLKISEDMAALNPGKTLSDAVEAIADLAVGETERMKEFGFKISQEDIKKAGGAMKVMTKKVAKMFDGGADKLSNSASGMWSTITGTFSSGISDMGVETLNILKPQLQIIADYLSGGGATKLFTKGSQIMADFTNEVIKGAYKVSDYIRTNFTDNPEFMRMSLSDKINFILKSDAAAKIVDFGMDIGSKLMSTVGASMMSVVKENPLLALVLGGVVGLRTGGYVGLVVGLSIAASPAVMEMLDFIRRNSAAGKGEEKLKGATSLIEKLNTKDPNVPLYENTALTETKPKELSPLSKLGKVGSDFVKNPFWLNSLGDAIDGSHRSGLDSVPFDGYVAQLHKGETVLPKRVARDYRSGTLAETQGERTTTEKHRNGGGGSSGGVTVNMNGVVVRQDSDINSIAAQLFRLIKDADDGMGVAAY